ncbi:hypothetical protein Cni_G22417 [Canna indica]|uniref:Pentatricopeptide repeat-containing protein n=1 Tax=Canna indica TaxID=4628 RepID=A0AAQ3KRT4_9LILI|nr:hypothetical protein Cni_G22417 [Canna indica]
MRNAWRKLPLRSLPRIASCTSGLEPPILQVRVPELPKSTFLLPFLGRNDALPNPAIRWFSSDPAGSDEIKAELESLNLSFSQHTVDMVLQQLRCLQSASKDGRVRLNSKAYNRMLETLGKNRRSEEFWRVVETMKKKGFGISKDTYLAVSKSFEEEKMEKDVNLLKEAYSLGSVGNETGRMRREICKILREEGTGEAIQKKLDESNVSLSSELVITVLKSTSQHPDKALLFLEWVEKKTAFKIDGVIYKVMAKILSRKDCIIQFQSLLQKMRAQGYELDKETYIEVSHRLHQYRIIVGAVDVYELAMGGLEKPSPSDFLFLFKKVVVSKDLHYDLITRIVRIFIDDGNCIKGSVFDGVLKSLASVGRLAECDKVLKAMEEGGFVADSSVYDRVVIGLCNAGRVKNAYKMLKEMVAKSNVQPLHSTYKFLIENLINKGYLGEASVLMELMKTKGFHPIIDPFIRYMSKSGTVDDAMGFLKAMTVKEFPSKTVFIRLFETLLKAGRYEVAHGILSKSPGCVRNHADVLDLFYTMKPNEASTAAA